MFGSPPRPTAVYFLSDRALLCVTLAAVLLGSCLRVAWPLDIEYKADEQLMFEWAQRAAATHVWPAVGMASGAGSLPNPGLSVWVFAALSKLTGVSTPVGLARVVQTLNCLALVAFACLAVRVGGDQRRIWLWAAILAALSPSGILLQRKLWAQSVLPLLCVLLLVAWLNRRKFWGALAWSTLALLAGQIHMTGFIFFGAVTLWTLLFWRTSMHWLGFATGAIVGGITAWPWLEIVVPQLLHPTQQSLQVLHVFGPQFWGLWLTDAFGVGLLHPFGGNLGTLLSYPLIGGHATYLVGAAECGVILVLVALLAQGTYAARLRSGSWQGVAANLAKPQSDTHFLCSAGLVAYGVFLSLPDISLYRHYLLILFPLPYLWIASLALSPESPRSVRNEKLLLAVALLNLCIIFQMFSFLRANGGAPLGDFGLSWSAQNRDVTAH